LKYSAHFGFGDTGMGSKIAHTQCVAQPASQSKARNVR
jgi:hypothetical protein